MSGPPCIAGPLAGRIVKQYAGRQTGILTLTRDRARRLFCFEEGWLIYAASNVIEDQLGESLVRKGLLSEGDLEAINREAQRAKKKQGALLREHGGVPEEELRTAMEDLVRELLSSCLEWTDAEQRFDLGRPRLDGEVTVRVSPIEVILAHTREHPASIDVLRGRIGPPDLIIERRNDEANVLEGLGLDPVSRYLLEQSEAAPSVGQLVPGAPADEEATLRALYALLLVRVLQPAGTLYDDDVAGEAERPPTREEVLARLAKADRADHYLVLGVERSAEPKQIRDAYYFLARRMHPDRYRSGELVDLLDRMEKFFTRVTEAYNTLINPENRAAYDEMLAEGVKEDAETQTDSAHLARQNYRRGKELAERKRHQEALQFLENAVKLDPTRAEYYLELGLLQSRNPRMRAEAERSLLRVTELEPTETRSYMALGDMYRRANHPQEAARMYEEVLRWDPGNLEAGRLLREVQAAGRGGSRG